MSITSVRNNKKCLLGTGDIGIINTWQYVNHNNHIDMFSVKTHKRQTIHSY